MSKPTETDLLLRVWQANEDVHGCEGWYCNRCEQACETTFPDLCRCCQEAYLAIEAAGQ